MAKKLFDIAGTLLLFIGVSLAFLPHAVHIKAGLNEGTSHIKHVIYGIILMVAALAILIYNNDALKFKINKKKI